MSCESVRDAETQTTLLPFGVCRAVVCEAASQTTLLCYPRLRASFVADDRYYGGPSSVDAVTFPSYSPSDRNVFLLLLLLLLISKAGAIREARAPSSRRRHLLMSPPGRAGGCGAAFCRVMGNARYVTYNIRWYNEASCATFSLVSRVERDKCPPFREVSVDS